MKKSLLAQLKYELAPQQLLPSLTAGLVVGVVSLVTSISLAMPIFSDNLATFVSQGIGLMLFGAVAMGLVNTLTSSFSGIVAIPQGSPIAVIALIAATVANRAAPSMSADALFATIVTAIALTSFLTGLFLIFLGRFNLGELVRYIPYPVVGGFLAGTGMLLTLKAIGVMIDSPFGFAQLPVLIQPGIWFKWLPGVVFAVVLLLVSRRYSHFLIIPGMLLTALVLFYLTLILTGTPLAQAGARGWLLGPFPHGRLWHPPNLTMLRQVDWLLVVGEIGNMSIVAVVSAIALLLKIGALELVVQRDMDLNRELVTAGWGNLAAALGGSPVGYISLGGTVLGYRLGSNSRLIGLTTAALSGIVLFFGAPFLSILPEFVLSGMLLFLGLSFLVEWGYDAWFKFTRYEYGIVLVIMIVMSTIGVLESVGLGIIFAMILFVVDYSRISAVKHVLSGATFQSSVERPRLYRQLLRAKGDWIYILELQGFIFFGTAHKLVTRVRDRLANPDLVAPRYVVLDFRLVKGIDASVILNLMKMKQIAEMNNLVLVFTDVSTSIKHQLETQIFTEADAVRWRVFSDLDHGVEWCEEQLIRVFEEAGISAQPARRRPPRASGIAVLDRFYEDVKAEHSASNVNLPLVDIVGREHLERREVQEGELLIRRGDVPDALYFIESGGAVVQFFQEDGSTARLRKMKPNTIVGEIGFYTDAPATASVMVTEPSVIYVLTQERLTEMETTAPATTVAIHRFIAELLSERLAYTTATIKALRE